MSGTTITVAPANGLLVPPNSTYAATNATDLAEAISALSGVYVAGRKTSTDGSHGLPAPTGTGLEFVFTAAGLDDIRYDGVSQ